MKNKTKCYCGHTDYCDCILLEESKQETPEEAAFNFTAGKSVKEICSRMDFIRGSKFGAKWQQEQDKNLYSEEDIRITFETAKLAKKKGFDIKGQNVFDLKNNNKIINFKDLAIQEFIDDVETAGYLDKAFNYLKEDIDRTDDNSDKYYYLLAPTQSLLAKWLREKHNLHISINIGLPHKAPIMYYSNVIKFGKHHKSKFKSEFYKTYEEAYEIGLQEALKLI